MKVLLQKEQAKAHCMPGDYACANGGVEKANEYHILLPARHLYSEAVRLLTILSAPAINNVGLMAISRIQ